MSTVLQELSAATAEIVSRIGRNVVSLHGQRVRASGFVWRDGLIVTADDTLPEDGELHVTLPGGTRADARIVGRDPTTDIALLRVADGLPGALALDSDVPAAGSLALAVGSRDGDATSALGVVSLSGERWQSLRGGDIDSRLELDLRLREDGEGGVAVSADGRAFGMVVFGPRRRVLVIPSATVARVAAILERDGRVARGYLGLGLQPVRVGDGKGAIVMSVDPKGPGAAAGIHQGDVIARWNGQPIGQLQPLIRSLGPDSVGRTLSFEIRRAGAAHETTLQIGERPAS